MSLTHLGTGILAKIIRLSGTPKLRKYLTELGFVSGKTIEVLQHSFGNNIIVALGKSKIALNKKIAHHVHISLEQDL